MTETQSYTYNIIARMHTEFPSKFGIPRQSGMATALRGRIVFEPPYRNAEALRGLEDFSHLWVVWDFSEAHVGEWHPTVRPPRLGGNRRMGVWATRSPFRPNNIGLSSMRIHAIHLHSPEGPVIEVEGPDLMDGTPILDIKPYLPYTDSHPDATGGFTQQPDAQNHPLQVEIPPELASLLPTEKCDALRQVLSFDPRPRYQDSPTRIYAMPFARHEVKFRIEADRVIVVAILNVG
ncbi:MAG: tRNA (N6-threonylcarbamoyladenosine(37)-N6)-methyltransferase TrmO [Bacteroidaceae bacterium]|nr:tRNA (N6-threonylcarbamoyladenosine(37)-N6)-methyltransferase TrmO [Bacteroidaceae bacterium]